MKILLLDNKFHLSALAIVLAFFIGSIFLRSERLNQEINPRYEWITAHTLITHQAWNETGGPSAHHFSPLYTLDGKGNRYIHTLGGVQDEIGQMYYISYPPLSFLASYYACKLLGGHNEYNLRSFGLIIHFFCALFIYLLVKSLASKKGDYISISGLFGAFLYLFSSGTLWMHSVLFFADTFVQLFLILGIYLLIKIVKREFKSEKTILILTGLIFFAASYTEWLAVFASFIGGFGFLIAYFLSKDRLFLKVFILLGIVSALAVTLTIVQYSQIAGFEVYQKAAMSRFEIRSGHSLDVNINDGNNVSNPATYRMLVSNITRNFLMAINLIGIISISLFAFLIYPKTRKKFNKWKLKVYVILGLFLSVLIHYFVFFNFNAIHNFSNLKTGFLIIMVISIILVCIEDIFEMKYKLVLLVILVFLGITRGTRDFQRFENFEKPEEISENLVRSANIMKKYAHPNQYAFTNQNSVSPGYIYIAHHLPYQIKDTSNIAFLMDVFDTDTCQYYYHSKDSLEFILLFKLVGKKINQFDKIDLSSE